MGEVGNQFEELVKIVSELRAPDGCPWDREQTNQSLLPYLIEEAYELIESVDEKNWENVKEELGDLLLHVVFQGSIAEQDGKFQLVESLITVNEKLIVHLNFDVLDMHVLLFLILFFQKKKMSY